MRTGLRNVASFWLCAFLGVAALMAADPAHAFPFFRRGRNTPPAEQKVEEESGAERSESPSKRRMAQLTKERAARPPKQQLETPPQETKEPAAKRRWWHRRSERVKAEKPAKKKTKTPAKTSLDQRYHLLIPDATLERELLDLFAHRRRSLEQIALLRELLDEKKQALAGLNKRQQERFNMKPEVMYEYDATNRTVYALGSVAERRAGASDRAQRKLHLQFVKDEQAALFLTLNTGKHLVLEQIRALGLLIAEKQVEAGKAAEALEQRFAIRADRNYRYEQGTRRLNELQSAPSREDMTRPDYLIQAPAPAAQ